ncbi:hypothetical protein [Sphingopyxis macrogoltabida]|uniref:Uncharacterized protein n=1 Tax=Sphingopyxis macrogoltabida TaxID=33050 RepID=A0AAC8Z1S9_SPHMC|nr:hypothetical protein [Sphingopyxis macrogoltabida]ALJ14123.1 hypothetical protein LH19_14715 [Sphingopyxis macrogoltabida]AMU90390.1 hypothetical protein ATM17_15295 [Sphingopyxis macrogoltabida]
MNPTVKHVTVGDNALTLTFNFGTMCTAEKELGKPFQSLWATGEGAVSGVSFDTISILWWAALQRKHRMSRDGANALVDDAGIEQVSTWLTEGMADYFGTSSKADGEADADPAPDEPKAGNAKRKKG